jgi:hypothetical protein
MNWIQGHAVFNKLQFLVFFGTKRYLSFLQNTYYCTISFPFHRNYIPQRFIKFELCCRNRKVKRKIQLCIRSISSQPNLPECNHGISPQALLTVYRFPYSSNQSPWFDQISTLTSQFGVLTWPETYLYYCGSMLRDEWFLLPRRLETASPPVTLQDCHWQTLLLVLDDNLWILYNISKFLA